MRTSNAPPPVTALAEAQWGVVSRAQLVEAGITAGTLDRWVKTGRLRRVHRGVYAVGHSVLTLEGRWMAAVLACGPGAVLSHRSAAHLCGMRRTSPDRIDVTTPRRGGRTSPRGVQLHRTRYLPPQDTAICRDIPTTTPERTLTDLADILTPRELERAADRAENQHLHAPITARNGRRGTPSLNWPQYRLIAETDGYATHHTRQAFEHDRRRDQELLVAGWRTVRFSYEQVMRRQAEVAATLRALLTPTPPPARPPAAAPPR